MASPALAADPEATTTRLIANSDSVTEGGQVTFTATVDPAAAGSVEFFNDTTSLGTADTYDAATGVATLTTAALPVGTNSVTATFTPTDTDALSPSTSDPVSVTVTERAPEQVPDPQSPQDTTTTLTGSTVFVVGSTAYFTATVTPHVAGTVKFFNGTNLLDENDVNIETGRATLTTADLPLGSYTVKAVFEPDDETAFKPSTGLKNVTVVNGTTTELTVDQTSVTEGDEVTLTATVAPASAAGTVEFFIFNQDTFDYISLGTVATDPNTGVATLSTTELPVGTNHVHAFFTPYDGDTFAVSRSDTTLVTVDEATTDDGTEGDEESSETDTLPQTGDSSAPVAALTLVAATTLTAGVSYALVGRTKAQHKF